MAFLLPYRGQEDDFVLTISDDDQDIPLLDDEEEVPALEATTKKVPRGGKKRKRGGDSVQSFDDSKNNGSRKKAKKSKSLRENAAIPTESTDLEEEDQSWAAGGEDDGAMDSDFEFQIGDVDTGVFDDFDGWGLSSVMKPSAVHGNKKGVDIDALIARRRTGEQEQEKVGTNIKTNGMDVETLETDSDREEDLALATDDHEVTDDEADEFGEEDETLAADGFGMGAVDDDEDVEDGGMTSDQDTDPASDDDSVAAPVPHPDDVQLDASLSEDEDNFRERERREAFFAPDEKITKSNSTKDLSSGSFQTMSLSRPILRGLASVGFSEPTPIQKKTIPIALLGKDVVGGAVTGSGKTAAFIIPILERLLYRPKKVPTSRVAILMPTRELAVQCFNVAKKLANFTDVTFCQLVGGFSLREQENILRSRPDVIIATPGRFIDHMRNSASFTVDTLEILVLDEADRMLEDGFADELNEILTTIPKSRQTMLFSATMTDSIDKLIRVGLNKPVRLLVDARKQTVGTLVQEFVRLRPGREDKRLGYLMHLCENIFSDRVIIFFRQKKEAHRVRVVFGLCGLKAAELHGSMSQEQRISSIEAFRDGKVSFLLATDVASRGLDIKGVETVINYEAPQSHEIYLHRVGRTARAGRTGRSCTIAAEPDRKVVKAAVKSGKAQGAKIVSRVVESGVADAWAKKIDDMREEIEEILKEEKEEKQLSQAEMQVRRGENIMGHEEEIMARPRRTWFESEKEKMVAKKSGAVELNGVGGKEKRKLSGKDKKRLDDSRERGEGKVWKKGKGERGEKAGKAKERGKSGRGRGDGVKGRGRARGRARGGGTRGRGDSRGGGARGRGGRR